MWGLYIIQHSHYFPYCSPLVLHSADAGFRHNHLSNASMVNTRPTLHYILAFAFLRAAELWPLVLFVMRRAHSLAEHTHILTTLRTTSRTLRQVRDGFQCQFYTSTGQSRFAGESDRSAIFPTTSPPVNSDGNPIARFFWSSRMCSTPTACTEWNCGCVRGSWLDKPSPREAADVYW